ncbi:MAG: GxxExxY protein [Planctomycetota bacterium]|nr:MAG: GxxExxY protein [Planctomycetota bacterium]
MPDESTRDDPLTRDIIGAAIEVHKTLGPGLLESAYEACLAKELSLRGLRVERQSEIKIEYKGERLDCVYRADLIVERTVLLEIKAVEQLLAIHEAQVLTYLRLTGLKTALLLNFNTPYLRGGIKRLSN